MSKGLMDNLELIDSLIEEVNFSIGELMSGERVIWCGRMVSIVQKLNNLKKGVENDIGDLRRQIEELTEMNNELSSKVYTSEARE